MLLLFVSSGNRACHVVGARTGKERVHGKIEGWVGGSQKDSFDARGKREVSRYLRDKRVSGIGLMNDFFDLFSGEKGVHIHVAYSVGVRKGNHGVLLIRHEEAPARCLTQVVLHFA